MLGAPRTNALSLSLSLSLSHSLSLARARARARKSLSNSRGVRLHAAWALSISMRRAFEADAGVIGARRRRVRLEVGQPAVRDAQALLHLGLVLQALGV